MVRKKLFLWELAGVITVGLVGTLLHFAYEWTGGSGLAAAFSAVNESTWEHMKLMFFSMLLFSAVQFWLQGSRYPGFSAVRCLTILTAVGLIPVLFYTYTGVLGRSVDWVNIAIFYVAELAAFWLDGQLLRQGRLSRPWMQALALLALWGLAFVFIRCTWRPVELPLWQDPVSGRYGIP